MDSDIEYSQQSPRRSERIRLRNSPNRRQGQHPNQANPQQAPQQQAPQAPNQQQAQPRPNAQPHAQLNNTLAEILTRLRAIELDNAEKTAEIQDLTRANEDLQNQVDTNINTAKEDLEAQIKANRPNFIGLTKEETEELFGEEFPSIYKSIATGDELQEQFEDDKKAEEQIEDLHDLENPDDDTKELRKTAIKFKYITNLFL